jgi:GNAT superfamily N-acetyltransferase
LAEYSVLKECHFLISKILWKGIREDNQVVDQNHQGKGFGDRLLAQALRDCYEAGQIFAFVAVLIDCLVLEIVPQAMGLSRTPVNPIDSF